MNASPRLFVNDRRSVAVARIFAASGLCGLLAACAGNPFATAAVDPTSPIAAEVTRMGQVERPYPKFSDIPEPPTDVRGPRQFAAAAAEVESGRAALERDTAENTWTLTDTLSFASQAEIAAGADPAPTAQDAAATEALARRLRERATPPPLSR
jgi:hypothetical protein